MTVWVNALVAVAAIALTYLFCVRPHLHGRRQCLRADAGLDRRIAALRAEIRSLRDHPATDPRQEHEPASTTGE